MDFAASWPEHGFLWATGIEDTFVPQEAPGRRKLDLYELQQHYQNWRQDLDLAGELGVDAIRYGIPWYRVNPAPGKFNWRWTDKVLQYIVLKKQIIPLIDLVHYGCPLWLNGEFMHPDYPQYVSEYAAAFARHYRDLGIRFYTPLNEPLVNAEYCGLKGRWPPYRRGETGFVAMLGQLARGIILTVEALRSIVPESVIVHVDAATSISAGETGGAELRQRAEALNQRRYIMYELIQGRVGGGHFLHSFLTSNGMTEGELRWFQEHGLRLDIVGLNYYPEMSVSEFQYEDGRELLRPIWGGASCLKALVREYWRKYRRPILLTETSTNQKVADRAAWLKESIASVRELRSEGIPVVGYTWWPLYDLINWDYREGAGPVEDYIEPMGLWKLRLDKRGRLRRLPTPVVDLFRQAVSTDLTSPAGG